MIPAVRPFVALSRPLNVAITMLSVLIAAVIAGPLTPLSAVVMACLSAGLIAAAANTLNDVFDLEIDRINKPSRPLPAGETTPRDARRAAVLEYGAGMVLASLIGPLMAAMAILFSALTAWYAAHLKRTVLWGNIAVSLSTAAAFIYGGLAVNRPLEAVIPAVFAFFFHLGREIIKDMADIEGDRQGDADTLAVRYGTAAALRWVRAIFLAVMVLTAVPYVAGWYSLRYFLTVIMGVYPVTLYTMFSISRRQSPDHLNFISNLLKADMLVGLLAIYLR